MNILFMEAGESGQGGSFVSLLQMLTVLSNKGHKLTVILWNSSPLTVQYEALGTSVFRIDNPIYTVGNNKFKFIYDKLIGFSLRVFPPMTVWIELILQHSCYRKIIKISEENNIDLIHLNNQPCRNFVGFLVAKRLKLPVISHIRTLHHYGFTHAQIKFIKKLDCKMLAVSSAVKQCWEKAGIPAQWIEVVHNPYDGRVKRDPVKIQHFLKKIVYVGRLESSKGLDFLIESFARATKNMPNLSLTIIGAGNEYDRLFCLRKQYNLDENLNFLGYIKDAKKHLSEFDVLVLPSRVEGFGRVIIEAMAHGVCVIATKVGGIVDIIKNEINGLLVEYGDKDALSNALLTVTSNDALRQKMIERAYKTVETQFNQDRFYPKLIADYRSLKKNQGYDIVIVISDLGSGGTQRVVSQLINYWNQHDKTIAVVTLAPEATDFFVLSHNIDRYVIGGISDSKNKFIGLFKNINRIRKLRRLFFNIKPKKILSFLCATNIITILAAHNLNIRVIISERNDPLRQSFGFIWNWLREKLYHQADMVTANTHKAIKTMSRYVPKNKLKWIRNPIAELMVNNAIIFDRPTILAVGRLNHQKAYDILLQAFAKFHHDYPNWQLAILGHGPLKVSLETQAKLLGITPYVTWYGQVNNPFPYYLASKIFVMPSRYEGMPNALLEAMSCGLPVIITDALPGPLEYVQDNISGLVVPVENVSALAVGLSRLAGDGYLRECLAAEAKNRLSGHCIQEVIEQWNSLLN